MRREVVAYLARRPFENVFLQWIIESSGVLDARDAMMAWRDHNDAIVGVAYFGQQLVLAADDAAAVDAFAVEGRKHGSERMIVGAKANADRYWAHVRGWHKAPSLVRERQPVYVLVPGALADLPPVPVRRATQADAPLVAEHSARMIEAELGYDPLRNRGAFTAGVRRLIDLGWWWVWIADGELRFQCNIGCRSEKTAQIQGVWTPEEMRGNGYATLALAAIAQALLAEYASLSLYVNDFNTDAIALYERLGFAEVSAFATYLFV
jgi:ribosomal protein S18 acetylase RimI-like enzyme